MPCSTLLPLALRTMSPMTLLVVNPTRFFLLCFLFFLKLVVWDILLFSFGLVGVFYVQVGSRTSLDSTNVFFFAPFILFNI
jgi:hypothetical protein